jgi:hypothetical protein
LPSAKHDSLPLFIHGDSRTVDDDWADAAETIPGGWGGLFVDGGVPILFLADTTKLSSAIVSMQGLGIGAGLDLTHAQARRARWDFAQMGDWFAYLLPRVREVAGTTWADINEAKNRLEFGVSSLTVRQAVEAELVGMNLPCFLVALVN